MLRRRRLLRFALAIAILGAGIVVALAPRYRQPELPRVSTAAAARVATVPRTAYVQPVGRVREEVVALIAATVRERTDLDVRVVPRVAPPAGAVAAERGQVAGEAVLSQLRRRFGSMPRSSVVLGVTEADVFMRTQPWRFAFLARDDGARVALVSTARIDPRNFHRVRLDLPWEGDLEPRLEKLAARAIGFVHLRLPPSDDRGSVLYRELLGVRDLDAIGDAY